MRLHTLAGGTISDRSRHGAPANVAATAAPSGAKPSTAQSNQGKRALFCIVTALIFLAGVGFSANAIASTYDDPAIENYITGAAICVAIVAMMLRIFGPALYLPRKKSKSWQALFFHTIGSVGTLAWLTLIYVANALLYNYFPPQLLYNLMFVLFISIVAIITLRGSWGLRFAYYASLFAIGCWSAVHYAQYYNGVLKIDFEVAFGAVLLLLSVSGPILDLHYSAQSGADPNPPPTPR